MIYRGSGFLAVLWFVSSPTPFQPYPVCISSIGDTQENWENDTTCWWAGGSGWDGAEAKSYDDEKPWSSINHWILSARHSNTVEPAQYSMGSLVTGPLFFLTASPKFLRPSTAILKLKRKWQNYWLSEVWESYIKPAEFFCLFDAAIIDNREEQNIIIFFLLTIENILT